MIQEKSVYPRRLSLCVLFAAFLLFVSADASSEAAYGALKICANVLVPSLFPYMVISSLIVSFGSARLLGGLLSPLCRILRLPRDAAAAIVLGALCGFPVGAKTACSLYEDGRLNRSQTERLIALANNTGPAFVIEVVGAHFWGSRGFGLTVYAAQILSAILIGIVYARRSWERERAEEETVVPACRFAKRKDVLSCVAEAVSSAAYAVLCVCGFVVFFAVVLALLSQLLQKAQWILPPIASFLEFTGGALYSSRLGGEAGAFLSGFAVGWSGVSVFAQCKTFAAPLGIRLAPAAIGKAVQGIITGIAAAVYVHFFYTPSVSVSGCIPVRDTSVLLVVCELAALVLFCFIPMLFPKSRKGKPS